MAALLPYLRPRAFSICSSCLRHIAATGRHEANGSTGQSYQQVRGKKKLPNHSATVTVRLLKDVETYGRKGAFVPVVTGQMRNNWFPRRIAEYVTRPDLKRLHTSETNIERDYFFTTKQQKSAKINAADVTSDPVITDTPELRSASMFQQEHLSIGKMSATRKLGLIDIFVPPFLEFYRQPIIEEAPSAPRTTISGASGAANDLLLARSAANPKANGPRAIYGSVTTQDVLVAVQAAMAENPEASQVALTVEDIQFIAVDAEKIKHVGDVLMEISQKGVEQAVRRTVRVIAQEQ